MATVPETLDAEILRRMTYSELKKVAKKHGVKGNMKAEKIISTLISVNSDDMESFTTPLQTRINSSRKNKQSKFDEDQRTPLDTPRRGTYTIESPSECYWAAKDNLNTASSTVSAALAPPIPMSSVTVSASLTPVSSATVPASSTPVSSDTVHALFTPVSPAVDISIQDMINVTTVRGSERKLRPRKVSFLSPKKTPRSPKYLSLKDRPKTPIASRLSTSKRVSFSTPVGQQRRKSLEKVLRVTPHPSSAKSINNSSSSRITPGEQQSAKLKRKATPSSSRITPGEQQSAKLKRKATPNFKQIHKKAFDKMESIDDYQKRKNLNSAKKLSQRSNLKTRVIKAKSKIPVPFSGIPFVPSALSTKAMNFNFAPRTMKDLVPETKNAVSNLQKRSSPLKTEAKRRAETLKENTSHKSKTKFDLKASLSKKLGYRPYTGKLKPLAESNSDHSKAACIHKPKIQNKVITENRSQTRSLLKGVRTNKRFDLQMKNRKFE